MVLAARIREMLGLPGMTVEETVPFRDKEIMKRVLDRAGIRTPKHGSATTVRGVREEVERIGFPVIVKPIAGAGSSHTYRVDSARQLEEIVPALRSVDEVSIEEFVEGEDCTFDTLCIGGEIRHFSVAFYRPRALLIKELEWVSPMTVAVRDPLDERWRSGVEMGPPVLSAMRFRTGLTHMEWYRTADGEAVFGEVGARPPGAHLVDLMNFACDIDLYTGWAEAVCHGRFTQKVERTYNSAWVFKRAEGQGRIQRVEGLDRLMAEIGEHVCAIDLNPIGSPRRDFRQVLAGDGKVFVRHPDLGRLLEIADRVATELRMYAS
jgi:biotin carboxylase